MINKIEQNIKNDCLLYLRKHSIEGKCELATIYYNPNNIKDVIAYIIDRHDSEKLQTFTPYKEKEPVEIIEWDYSVDDYDFAHLQEGYELAFMDMKTHHGFWCSLEQLMPEEIYNTKGLQNYLMYCKKNGISKQVIEYSTGLTLREDAMKHCVEINQGYTIIAECIINKRCIVLAKNINATAPYVTWETTPNRKYGYTAGHYLSTIKEATKDYVNRSKQELDYAIRVQKDLSSKQKKEQER